MVGVIKDLRCLLLMAMTLHQDGIRDRNLMCGRVWEWGAEGKGIRRGGKEKVPPLPSFPGCPL
jgi:hypothetical protein